MPKPLNMYERAIGGYFLVWGLVESKLERNWMSVRGQG